MTLTLMSTPCDTAPVRKTLHFLCMADPERISAKPLFDTFEKRGDLASFAKKLNVSVARLMNWKKRGIPSAQVRAVAHAMSLRSSDDYYRLADNGQKAAGHGQTYDRGAVPQSEAEKFLALAKTFLDTDAVGQHQILEAANSLRESRGSEDRRNRRRTPKRR